MTPHHRNLAKAALEVGDLQMKVIILAEYLQGKQYKINSDNRASWEA